MSRVLAGIFVGGDGRRMGRVAKGMLVAPDGRTLVARWVDVLTQTGAEVVLVGAGEAYAGLGIPRVDDRPGGIGPLGGLVGLLERANGVALAVACDMPYVERALIERLVAAPDAPVLAPRREGRWEPLLARYDALRVLPTARDQIARGDHALQRLLDRVDTVELPLLAGEGRALADWDSPEDMRTL